MTQCFGCLEAKWSYVLLEKLFFFYKKRVFPKLNIGTKMCNISIWCMCISQNLEFLVSRGIICQSWRLRKLIDIQIYNPFNSPLKKRERTGTSFLYWLDWKSKHFNWNVTEWKATQPSLRVFSRKLFKWEPHKSCKIPYKSL